MINFLAEPSNGAREGLGACILVVAVAAVRMPVTDTACVLTSIGCEIIGVVPLTLMEDGTVCVEGTTIGDSSVGVV